MFEYNANNPYDQGFMDGLQTGREETAYKDDLVREQKARIMYLEACLRVEENTESVRKEDRETAQESEDQVQV